MGARNVVRLSQKDIERVTANEAVGHAEDYEFGHTVLKSLPAGADGEYTPLCP